MVQAVCDNINSIGWFFPCRVKLNYRIWTSKSWGACSRYLGKQKWDLKGVYFGCNLIVLYAYNIYNAQGCNKKSTNTTDSEWVRQW
jgi:hypothetical protein